VYTILALEEEYAQCNYPWAYQGHIYKHAVKVYKMIHPDVQNTTIIRLRGSLRGTIVAGHDTSALDSFRSTQLVAPPIVAKNRAGEEQVDDDSIQGLCDLHRDIEQLAEGGEKVLAHALHHSRVSRGKVLDFVASSDGKTTHPLS
jgi:hypothetical protein